MSSSFRPVALPHWPGTNVDNYRRALEAAGLRAVAIVPEHALRLADCFGLLLLGGVDVDPALYGATPDPRTQSPVPERDAFELSLLRAALARDLPVLAICRGLQLLNVAFGGQLLQHIENGGHVALGPPSKSPSQRHTITVAPDSKLAEALGAESIEVNSRHHQAVAADTLAPGLTATAWSHDGLVEGVESEAHRWVVGVQWHPERPEPEIEGFAETSQRLFDAFARSASSTADAEWRPVRPEERALLDRLLQDPFQGRDPLREQLIGARVRTIDNDGSIKFSLLNERQARVIQSVPVEGHVSTTDGNGATEVVLHVRQGLLTEMEIVNYGDAEIGPIPDAGALQLRYPQRGFNFPVPPGVLVPTSVPEGWRLSGASLAQVGDQQPGQLTVYMIPAETKQPRVPGQGPSIRIESNRRDDGSRLHPQVGAVRLPLRKSDGRLYFEAATIRLEWEEENFQVTIIGQNVRVEELFHVAEAMKVSSSEG